LYFIFTISSLSYIISKQEYFESRFERIFKTDYVTVHRKTVDSRRPWDSPETEPMIPFDEHLTVPLDKLKVKYERIDY